MPAREILHPHAEPKAVQDLHAINFSWLLVLRWGAIVGQITLILMVDLLAGIPLPLLPLGVVVAVETASNIAATRWARRATAVEDWVLGALMAFDVGLFTVLLYLTGGPLNPFSVLYLVYIALAAVVLPLRWSWALAVFSLACFAALFRIASAPSAHQAMAGAEYLRMHLEGMWFAYAVVAGFIVYFVQLVTRALAARETQLAEARAHTARNERLASLATLAAGAAHQLATPLSTIAIAARELEDQLSDRGAGATADARLIREQVERCREILLQLAADAGESTGESLEVVSLGGVIEAALRGLAERERVRIEFEGSARDQCLLAPLRSVAQALRAVVKNALEASPPDAAVDLRVTASENDIRIAVRDRGHGIAPEVLPRVGEPFFTTKGPDRGMGLGLFLTRTVLERLGGRLGIEAVQERGTRVELLLPRRVAATIDRIATAGAGGTS
jgi:two-component system, sensor histidine kinase RegB